MTSAKKISFVISLILIFTLLFSFCAFAEPDEGGESQSTPSEQVDPTSTPDPAPDPQPDPTPATDPQPDSAPTPDAQTDPAGSSAPSQNRTAARNTDNTLKGLTVYGITESGEKVEVSLSPAFKPDVREYSVSVPYNVVSLNIDASANNSKARVNIPNGYLKLDLGANKSYVYVTTENGTRRTYQINTTRTEQESTTEATTLEEITESTTEAVVTTEATTEETAIAVIDVQPQSMNKYTKLGLVFGAVGIIFLICSVALFVRNRKNKQEYEE
ncbi:MAG: cadherin-like beta sandwich domain-containing protein [Clostridia bacterium]|nr:cadherin-like beta sandwich domain-containing protein [Clostridia bacterium]